MGGYIWGLGGVSLHPGPPIASFSHVKFLPKRGGHGSLQILQIVNLLLDGQQTATVLPQQTWAEKWGPAVPVSVGELGPHLTQCRHSPGPSPTSIPSGILIPTTVWPQYNTPTLQTDSTDTGPVTYGTVTCNGHPKMIVLQLQ